MGEGKGVIPILAGKIKILAFFDKELFHGVNLGSFSLMSSILCSRCQEPLST